MVKIIEILNLVVNTGDIPDEWRDVNIIPLLKPSKNPSNANSYRPLSMLSVILKLINFSVKQKLSKVVYDNNLLPNYSFGFRKKTSAINCVNTLLSHVTKSKREGDIVIATFLDLTKAFDNVDISKLLGILKELAVPSEIINWIYYYLSKRRIILKLSDGTMLTKITNKGLPQGCPLSPILFNLYTHKIHSFKNIDEIFFQFADDFTLLVIARTLEAATIKMNNLLSKVFNFFSSLGLIINPEKCGSIIFTNKLHPTTNIIINNHPIEIESHHKFLGIYIDHKLLFNKQIDYTVAKAKRKINILKMLVKRKNGAHPSTMLKISKSIVQSQLDYGLTICASASKTSFAKLETVHHLYIRLSMRYLKSTPNHVILAETGELPLKYRAEFLAFKEIVKLIYCNSPLSTFLNEFIQSDYLPRPCTYLEKIASVNNFHLLQLANDVPYELSNKIKVNSEIENISKKKLPIHVQKQIVLFHIQQHFSDLYQVYTDGSKKHSKTGYGYYDKQLKISYSGRIKSQFSIMNAELIAISKAIDYLIDKNINSAVIFSDCQSAVKLIKFNTSSDNYLPCEIIKKINNSPIQSLIIQWIPGHIGLTENDRADRAAKLGTTRETIEDVSLTKSDLILNLKNETYCFWEQSYKLTSEEKGIFHYSIMDTISTKPWFHKFYLSLEHTIIISRLRSGHTATKDRLSKWGLIRDDKCDSCNVVESITHILFECPKFYALKKDFPLLSKYTDIITILKSNKKDVIKQLAEFFRRTKINV
jgi:ribonuclease HI